MHTTLHLLACLGLPQGRAPPASQKEQKEPPTVPTCHAPTMAALAALAQQHSEINLSVNNLRSSKQRVLDIAAYCDSQYRAQSNMGPVLTLTQVRHLPARGQCACVPHLRGVDRTT